MKIPESLVIIGIFLLIVAISILAPLGVIWCLNTLFPILAIPYTFQTWVATYLLMLLFNVVRIAKK